MRSTKYLPALKQLNRRMSHAPRGERIMSSLYPYRGSGYGWWGQNMYEQVQHFKNWTYVACNIICSKVGSMAPNMAYVGDQHVPGKTAKACQRGFANILGRGYGASGEIAASQGGYFPGANMFSDSGQTYLTIGEYRSKSLSVIKPHEELEPLENWHPLRRLLDNPNSVDTMFDLLYESQLFQELCGVSYTWVVPNEYGVPCELWVIPSHWVWPKTGGGRDVPEVSYYDANAKDDSEYLHPLRGSERLISHYEVRPWGGMGPAGALYLPADQVIMERWKNPMDKVNGYSTLTAIAQWIDLEESISKSRWAQMINQARPELWIELGEGYEDPDSDRLERMYAQLGTRIQGEFNVGRPFVTPPGAKVTPLSFNPTEMAYFQSEEQVRDMILSAKGVPKTAAGVSQDMTFGSVLATLATMCENCINPRLTMRGQSLSKHLASRWDEKTPSWSTLTGRGHGGSENTRRVRVWWDNCVPADPAQVNSDLQTDATFYGLTPNELRALRGRAPYRLGGNNPIVNGPAGPMPLPINEEEAMDDLGALVQQYTEQATSKKDVDRLSTEAANEDVPAEGGQDADGQPRILEDQSAGAQMTEPVDMDAGIEEPNGRPSKGLVRKARRKLDDAAYVNRLLDIWMEGRRRGKTEPSLHGDRDNPYHSGLEYDAWKAGYNQRVFPFEYSPTKGKSHDEQADRARVPQAKASMVDTGSRASARDRRGSDDRGKVLSSGRGNPQDARQDNFKAWCKHWQAKQLRKKQYGGHSYSSTQINLEDHERDLALTLANQIDDADLTEKGREDIPHITIRYGLETNDAGQVRQLVETFGPIKFKLGDVDYFQGDEHDVVIIRVESDDLHRMNELLGQLPNVQTHPTYQPHVTLAYVKPGMGQKYVDMLVGHTDDEQGVVGDEEELECRQIVFSPKEGTPTMLDVASFEWQEAKGLVKKGDDGLSKLHLALMGIRGTEVVDTMASWWEVIVPEDKMEEAKREVARRYGPVESVMENSIYVRKKSWSSNDDLGTIDKGALDSVKAAGRWLANKWASLEDRYGRKTALTMAVGMIATMPLPGNIAAIIAAAEALRGIGMIGKELVEKSEIPTIRIDSYGLDPSGYKIYTSSLLLDGKIMWQSAKVRGEDKARKRAERALEAWKRGETHLYDFKSHGKELIPGGLSDGSNPQDFDQAALTQGIKVEMEHTDDPAVAREIAMDHLTEDPQYYVKLRRVEGRVKKSLTALYEGFRDMEYNEIEAKVRAYLQPLSKDKIVAEGKAAGMNLSGTKEGMIKDVIRRIRERKGSWERTQFRSDDASVNKSPKNRLKKKAK